MFKVFENLDDALTLLANSKQVPLSEYVWVNKARFEELLDEVRSAYDPELDEAADILKREEQIIESAEADAAETISLAKQEAAETLDSAHSEANALVARADEELKRAHDDAADTMSRAHEEAKRLIDEANAQARDMIAAAEAEAQRRVAEGKDEYDKQVSAGLAERDRLVSETEITRRAKEEAHRVVDAAHADSKQLREQCDTYVDNKLAEFESGMSEVLRIIRRDRSALRSGAGATGSSVNVSRGRDDDYGGGISLRSSRGSY